MHITLLSTESDAWAFGLRSISAVLKKAGHHTRLIFMGTAERRFTQRDLDALASLTRHTDIVGVSCLARSSEKAKQVVEHLHLQKKFVVWGGIHASLNPEECVDYADIVCRGEGEGMMLDLAERMEQGRTWKDIENIAYKESGCIQRNKLRSPIPNLDELPIPDFSFADEYRYGGEGVSQVSTLPEVETGPLIFNSSRGCAFHCTYCCNAKIKNLYPRKDHYVRRMSVAKLVEHTQSLRKTFPTARSLYFIDEDFAARPVGELLQFAEEYPQKIGLPFECMAYPARATREKMDLLVKAGLYRINVGIESGSEHTKKEIFDRHVSNKVVKQAAEVISSYRQVVPKYFFIIGNPFEEREDLLATAKLIASLPTRSIIQTYNLVFFPGSYLYERAERANLIQGKHDSGYELDFLGGLDYSGYAWKKKNLYLNGLIYLMEGVCTNVSVGGLPRFMIDPLLQPPLMGWLENHPVAIRTAITVRLSFSRQRSFARFLIRKITGKPAAIAYRDFAQKVAALRRQKARASEQTSNL